MSINFQEHKETGYAMRTYDNARLSDLTIAFAIDFTTPGEILTRKAAYGKYYGLNLGYLFPEEFDHPECFAIKDSIWRIMENKVYSINFAGNSIQNLKGLTQELVDEYVFKYLQRLLKNCPHIKIIRSGGQTGVDEAALKAGDKLGLETICLAPKNWMFRNAEGTDICNEALFLKRFGPQYDITDIL